MLAQRVDEDAIELREKVRAVPDNFSSASLELLKIPGVARVVVLVSASWLALEVVTDVAEERKALFRRPEERVIEDL